MVEEVIEVVQIINFYLMKKIGSAASWIVVDLILPAEQIAFVAVLLAQYLKTQNKVFSFSRLFFLNIKCLTVTILGVIERWKGDWDCPNSSCGLMNYAYREECCYCQTPRIMIKEDEIQDGLQLCVIYEKVPTLAESKIALHGLHSSTALKDGTTHILLFTSMEALEDAKIKLDADKYVKSVDYMGVRSASRQVQFDLL